jgi:hypothetical protein
LNTSIYKLENTDADLDPLIEGVETHIMSCLEKQILSNGSIKFFRIQLARHENTT